MTLSVVCWQWNVGFRTYLPEHVNALARMVKRNLPRPHRFICVTDETEGFSGDVELLRTPDAAKAVGDIPSPEGAAFPSCYRRLWMFSDEAMVLGDRVLLLDIDCLVVDNLTPLLDRDEDFVGWRPNYQWGNPRIGGGTWLLRTGTNTHVWDDFTPEAVSACRNAGYRGSDQAWLSYKLRGCATWPEPGSGIFQSQDFLKKYGVPRKPKGARIIHFNGRRKAWQMRRVPWIRKALDEE